MYPNNMISVKLIGPPFCRRYQRMRAGVIEVAQRLGLTIDLVEVGEIAQLVQVNPLSLPRLYIGKELIASKNPPKTQALERALRECS